MSPDSTKIDVRAKVNDDTDHEVQLAGSVIQSIATGGWSEVKLVHIKTRDSEGKDEGEDFVWKRARQPVAFKVNGSCLDIYKTKLNSTASWMFIVVCVIPTSSALRTRGTTSPMTQTLMV